MTFCSDVGFVSFESRKFNAKEHTDKVKNTCVKIRKIRLIRHRVFLYLYIAVHCVLTSGQFYMTLATKKQLNVLLTTFIATITLTCKTDQHTQTMNSRFNTGSSQTNTHKMN